MQPIPAGGAGTRRRARPRQLGMIGAVLLVSAGAPPAVAQNAATFVRTAFAEIDGDSNGSATIHEFVGFADVSDHAMAVSLRVEGEGFATTVVMFVAIDDSDDALVTSGEMLSAISQVEDLLPSGDWFDEDVWIGRFTDADWLLVSRLFYDEEIAVEFEEWDRNGDWRLSDAEIETADDPDLPGMDRDGDGYVDEREILFAFASELKSEFGLAAWSASAATSGPNELSRNLTTAAFAFSREDEAEPAITLFRAATDFDPTYVLAWHALGFEFQRESEYERAIVAYRRALEEEPSNDDVKVRLGRLLACEWGDQGEGIALVRGVADSDPARLGDLTWIYHECVYDFQKALDASLERVAVYPDDTGARADLAEAYFTAGDHRQAVASTTELLRAGSLRDDQDLVMWVIRMLSYATLGQRSQFRSDLDQVELNVRQLDPFAVNWVFGGTIAYVDDASAELANLFEPAYALMKALEDDDRAAALSAISRLRSVSGSG